MPPKKQTKVQQPTKGVIQIVDGKRKFTPRPARPASERLPRLYRALTDQVNDGFFDNAKKTCKQILALDAASTSAFQTLLFLHLHTDNYAAALDLVENPPSPAQLQFERAYCLYRLHRERDALQQIQEMKARGRREEHLKAQVRYRLGEFDTAQTLYDDLLSGAPPATSEYDDIRTNQAATATQLAFITRDYTSHLSAPAVENPTAGLPAMTPSAGELETYVPSVPIGWATRGTAPKPVASTSAPEKVKRTKPRHKLPKGAVEGKPFTEDPDRWLPLRQRASFAPAAGKKKKELTGLGTQGSTSGGGGGGGGGGGHNKKKGKKK
ncbi:hypothetical protein CspHIS471_0506710 [Cutaneotrichosporon sp. HIS471]|nr:hypothetical protein CspHIS471_0506710 [Cutaneotrichosporon sp. HIS471]